METFEAVLKNHVGSFSRSQWFSASLVFYLQIMYCGNNSAMTWAGLGPDPPLPQGENCTQVYQQLKTNGSLKFRGHFEVAESRLLRDLFRYYNPAARPVQNASDTLPVFMDLMLRAITDVNLVEEILVTKFWVSLEWNDTILSWNPDAYGGVKRLHVPYSKIWVPDVVLFNDKKKKDSHDVTSAFVYHTGQVRFVPPKELFSPCAMNAHYFPFDVQKCILKFASWVYVDSEVRLFLINAENRKMSQDGRRDLFLLNRFAPGSFLILEAYLEQKWEDFSTEVDGNHTQHDVQVHLTLQRRTSHYVYHIIYPCILMSGLSLLVFHLSPESGEKIALGVTLLLTYHMLMLSVGEKMPESSKQMPIITIYLTLVMTFTCLSILLSVVVNAIHHHGSSSQVPHWLKKVFFMKCSLKVGNVVAWQHKRVKNVEKIEEELLMGDIGKGHQRLARALEKIEKHLELRLLWKLDEKRRMVVAGEWKQLAATVDRVLFRFFLVLISITTFTLLIIIPMLQ